MKQFVAIAALASAVFAQRPEDWPSGQRITPPTISRVSPQGIARGMTVEMEVEGFNLAKASAIYFSDPGVKGRILRVKELPDVAEVRLGSNGGVSSIDLGPMPPRNQVTIEIDVAASAHVGPVSFRLLTPLGTSPVGTFLVEPFYGEATDAEPNDSVENATEVYLPAILTGTISRNGDVDTYKIKARAGQQLVFDNGAVMLGSSLQPIVRILAEDQSVLAEFGNDGADSVRTFAHQFTKDGTYYIQVTDFQQSGRGSHTYRFKTGEFPVITSVYPLGIQQGKTATISVEGYNVGDGRLQVTGAPSPRDTFATLLRPDLKSGTAFNEIRLELGNHPEVEAKESGNTLAFPSIINGKLKKEATFQFRARKGEELVFEVNARRAGIDLDSALEVLDATGKPIERAVVRPVWETSTTLRDHDSAARGIRINSWNAIKVGDYVQIGSEIIKVSAMPKTPDDDMIFENFNGQRITYFDTTAEAHAIESPVYKVQIHPSGSKFSPNGLPLTRLYYRNDDGGAGFGKDSLLHFTAPADGTYTLRLTDVRGELPKAQPYRLTARRPEEDFRLSFTPRNPNVPPGSAVAITAQAFRMDGFNGPISLSVEGLPKGISATPAIIPPGQVFATILLKSAPDISDLQGKATPFQVIGNAVANSGKHLKRTANEEDTLKLLSTMPRPDITVTTITKVVEIDAGSTADVHLEIARQNGFKGRVPVAVLNLPPSVRVLDVGLNGVLINEDETKRSFTLAALPDSEPLEQVIYIAGNVETRSPQMSQYAAPEPVLLRVKSNKPIHRSGGELITGGGARK
jgi:hypothetical protein